MAKNKIITTQGNVQFINSKGRTINVHPMHVYSVYDGDTVSFLFLGMKDYSGQAFFSSQMEDLEVNGVIYDDMDDLKAAIGEAFAKSGAQARTEIVTELPEDPYTNTIYLLPKEHGEGYDEYIWNEDEGWQLIGDTDIEWERYLQIADFNVYSAATAEEIAYISGAVDTNADHIVALSGAIDTEIAAREAADAYISGAVDTVSADLATESQRAVSAETALGNRIDSANARIDAEQTARALADTFISGAVDTEVSNRISADTALQTAIDNEASARTDADSALSDKIDYVSGAVDTEVSARGAADSYISGAVDTLSSVKADKANAVASAVYVSSSTTIDLKNISGEVISQVDASDFIVDGMVEDVRIENGYLIIDFNTASGIEDIEIPLTDIFNPANYYDKDAIDGIVSGINDSIADEVSARTQADSTLQTNIDNEVSARTEADNTLQGNIDTVSGNVETETSRATSAETELQTAIDNEASVRTSADTVLQTAIDDEISARTTAIEAIEGEISGISDSLSAYSTTVEMNAAIDAAVSGKADADDVYTKSEVDDAITAATDDMATMIWVGEQGYITGVDLSNYATLADIPTVPTSNTAFTNDAGYITVDALSGLQETLSAGTNIDITNNVISVTGITIETSSAITSGDTNAVAGGAVYDKFDEVEQVTARALVDLNESLSGKADTSALSGYVATSAVTSAVTSGSTSVVTSGGVYQQMGGLKLVKLTQSQYDNLQTKDSNTLYIISD